MGGGDLALRHGARLAFQRSAGSKQFAQKHGLFSRMVFDLDQCSTKSKVLTLRVSEPEQGGKRMNRYICTIAVGLLAIQPISAFAAGEPADVRVALTDMSSAMSGWHGRGMMGWGGQGQGGN